MSLIFNQKLPRRARAYWPLVCVDTEIAWVPGYRLGRAFRFAAEKQNVVHIRLIWHGENSNEVVG